MTTYDPDTVFRYSSDEHGNLTGAFIIDVLKRKGNHPLARVDFEDRRISFNKVSVLGQHGELKDQLRHAVLNDAKGDDKAVALSPAEDRCAAAMLGMAMGDALGAPLEFDPVTYGRTFVTDMGDGKPAGNFFLLPGQFTDDSSMGLCMADSLLVNEGQWDPLDCMLRFMAWWEFGYNNAFAHVEGNQRGSVGLGGNINQSFFHFVEDGHPYTKAGNKMTSGCGSVMRFAPVPACFWSDPAEAMRVARLQSLTTHQGEEAAECCRLMAFVMCRAISHSLTTHDTEAIKQHAMADLTDFTSSEPSVEHLARSEVEPESLRMAGVAAEDRDWRWKRAGHRYSPERAARQPGYIGSYAMDNLAMALHCVWTTQSVHEAILKAANMCGDADSVAAVAGMIAGSIYGVKDIPKDWIRAVQQWDNNGEIALRGLLLSRLRQ